MSRNSFIWIGLAVGSTVGSYVPALWGASLFSFSSIIGSAVGGGLGIWCVFKLSQ